MFRSTVAVAAALTLMLALPPAARAGIADSPLPVLMAGADTIHLYSVPGVLASGSLGTFFSCTSTDTATMQIGVELFGPSGGAKIVDLGDGHAKRRWRTGETLERYGLEPREVPVALARAHTLCLSRCGELLRCGHADSREEAEAAAVSGAR